MEKQQPQRCTPRCQRGAEQAAAGAAEEPAGGAPPPLMAALQLPGTSHPAENQFKKIKLN